MPKVIYISHEPLTQYLYKLFYLQEMKSAGFEIEYWDCSEISWKNIVLPDIIHSPIVKKFSTIEAFDDEVIKVDIYNTIFSVELFRNRINYPIFKILSENNCLIVRFKLFENCELPTSFREILRSIKTGRVLIDIKNRIRNKMTDKINHAIYRCNKVKECDLIFSSKSNGNIYINHPDYDACLNNSNEMNSQKNIVYLDNYFPYHPDIKKNNPNWNVIDIEKHYKEMNYIFERIEKKYNLKVIIAAHPKSDYKRNEFNGRTIVKYHTRELIADAVLVLLHSSNAIAFAISYGIPFMFISSSQYKLAHAENNRMRRLSSYFKSEIISAKTIDEKLENRQEVDSESILKYKYTFLTHKSIENTPNREIIIAELTKLLKNRNKEKSDLS